ncbi:MAG: flavodoxin family protein [Eubacteriales bacterium]
MKIFALMCSHRKNKNTQYALEYFLKGFGEEHDIHLKRLVDLNVKMCIACDYCSKDRGACVHKDDMAGLIRDMVASDLIVIASPLYFNSVTSLFKLMIDRTQTLYNAKYVIKDSIFKDRKPVVLLCVAGAKHYKNQFKGIDLETEHFIKNINGKVIEYIQYNDTDRHPVIENKEFAKLLISKAGEIESMLEKGNWDE